MFLNFFSILISSLLAILIVKVHLKSLYKSIHIDVRLVKIISVEENNMYCLEQPSGLVYKYNKECFLSPTNFKTFHEGSEYLLTCCGKGPTIAKNFVMPPNPTSNNESEKTLH